MGLEVSAVDHDHVAIRSPLGELGKEPDKHAHVRPAHELVVERLWWPIHGGSVFLLGH